MNYSLFRKASISLGLIFFSFSAIAQKNISIENLHWLLGKWVSSDSTIVEDWTVQGDSLVGYVELLSPRLREEYVDLGKSTITEKLTIKQEGKHIFLVAEPSGQKPTSFKMMSKGSDLLAFENKENDFPQRIVYDKINNRQIKILLTGNEESRSFVYYKMDAIEKN